MSDVRAPHADIVILGQLGFLRTDDRLYVRMIANVADRRSRHAQ